VLDRAKRVLTELESYHLDEKLPQPKRRHKLRAEVQPMLFANLGGDTVDT
jgi:hypothetical protein